jgi:hypothetical protein
VRRRRRQQRRSARGRVPSPAPAPSSGSRAGGARGLLLSLLARRQPGARQGRRLQRLLLLGVALLGSGALGRGRGSRRRRRRESCCCSCSSGGRGESRGLVVVVGGGRRGGFGGQSVAVGRGVGRVVRGRAGRGGGRIFIVAAVAASASVHLISAVARREPAAVGAADLCRGGLCMRARAGVCVCPALLLRALGGREAGRLVVVVVARSFVVWVVGRGGEREGVFVSSKRRDPPPSCPFPSGALNTQQSPTYRH